MTPRRRIDRVDVRVFEIPTDLPESDGTLAWRSTTCVVVQIQCGDAVGLGYTYSHPAAAQLIENKLSDIVCGLDPSSPADAWCQMLRAVRNLGRQGLAAHAISAVDTAMWDLKARLLDLPLCDLWGRVRERVPLYGSGGFTSYDDDQLRAQLGRWVQSGMSRVKMKVGRHPEHDIARVTIARDAVGPDIALFVDANGAYDRKTALYFADAFHERGVVWYEEPVTSDDLAGLRLLRDRAPAGMNIAAGEYGYHPDDFRKMLGAGAVDVVQADVTRCLGFTGLFAAAAVCEAWHVPFSGHCSPALHAHAALCLRPLVHLEHFHDHVRIEERLFDGTPKVDGDALVVDRSRPGNGLVLASRRASEYEMPA